MGILIYNKCVNYIYLEAHKCDYIYINFTYEDKSHRCNIMKITDPMLKDKVWFTIISGLISLNPNLRYYMASVNILMTTQWHTIWNKEWPNKVIFQ